MRYAKKTMKCCICSYKYKIVLYKVLAESITTKDKLLSNKKNICCGSPRESGMGRIPSHQEEPLGVSPSSSEGREGMS